MNAPNNRSVLISYAASSPFLSTPTWSQIHNALLTHFPLRNLHWKPASRTSIRTIQELGVSLIPLDTVRRDELASQVPATILEKPLLNIYIVSCENTDLEGYRTTVKKQIKEWHSTISSRKNQEWLILHVVRPDARAQSGNFFQLKGSVIDKIRADFNSDKRDRCVQLLWTTGIENPAAWGEFINKLKDGVLQAFQMSVAQREEDVKRSEGQRQMPGWNFCTFFILKESLASSFEGVKLFDESLLQYDELEASFYQVLKEKNLSWFGTLITPDSKDDSAQLLSVSKKPYRDLILANTISVFDFRIYLLARQCELLAQSGRVVEICKKAGAFLGAFGRRLREVETTLPPFFIESWIYSSALSVVEQCDLWVADLSLDPSVSAFNAGKAELVELARHQLDIIGIKLEHLPLKPPFSSAFPSNAGTEKPSNSGQISNSQLLATFADAEAFYELYVLTTNRAIELYAKSGRRKFALKLHGSLAALDLHRGRLDTALSTYTSLPAHYALHKWTSLESWALCNALHTHSSLAKPRDGDWMHLILSFMKTYTESAGAELLITEEDKTAYISNLVDMMIKAATELETDLHHPDHPSLSLHVNPMAELSGERDGSFLEVTVFNHLPCAIPVTDVIVTILGRESERLEFTYGRASLESGKSCLRLFCPNPSTGAFMLDSSEIRISRLLLQWNHRKPMPKGSRTSFRPYLVKIPRDNLAFGIETSPPPEVELDGTPKLLVTVTTGRNDVKHATIELVSTAAKFDLKGATLLTDGVNFESSTEAVIFQDIPSHTTIELLVPHSRVIGGQELKLTVEAKYVTASEPGITRVLRSAANVAVVLPISVNVEDFFRGTRLFSRFTISTLTHQHVRIADVRLDATAGSVSIVSSTSAIRPLYTVKPSQPVSFIFQVNSSEGPVRDPLHLRVRYRMLREEVKSLIEKTVDDLLIQTASWRDHRLAIINKLVEILESDPGWIERYEISGEVFLPSKDDELGDISEAVERSKQVLQVHRHSEADSARGPWHTVKIPVDVPQMNIVAAVTLKLSQPSGQETTPLYAGQPIPATINIHTSFHWGSSHGDRTRTYAMQYDVEEMVKEWLISGKKRGNFIAKDNATFTVPITLVALHHGEYTLPKVSVLALPLTDEVTMGSMAIPTTEAYQTHGAESVLILPRGGRSTYVVAMTGR